MNNLAPNAPLLLLVGHMCWGYATGRMASSLLHVSTNPYLLLLIAAIPDIDLLLGVFGIEHRTWTHSIILWSLLFIPFFVRYRKSSIPYFVAVVQHSLFGDFIVGEYNVPFYPLSDIKLSLGYGPVSIQNVLLEMAGLAIFIFWIFRDKNERQKFFGRNRSNTLSILPLIPLVAFIIFVYSLSWGGDILIDLEIISLVTSRPLFPIEMALHLGLASLLFVSLIQGMRGRKIQEADPNQGA